MKVLNMMTSLIKFTLLVTVGGLWFMVFNVTFNTISVKSWRCFIGGGNRRTRRKPPTCRKSLTNLITYCCIEHISTRTGFELTTLVVIGTDCTCNCKSNYHTITTTTTTAPIKDRIQSIRFHQTRKLGNTSQCFSYFM